MKWIHVIGICGKATANVAKMFKDMGWFVTGSDAQYFPPAYDIILENEIPHVEGYHYSHVTREFWEDKFPSLTIKSQIPNLKSQIAEIPDLVMVMDVVSTKNKEYMFAKNKQIPVKTFSQIFTDYLAKPESIVIVGTAGKTTTTALITKLLKDNKLNPSYMVGADVKDFKDSVQRTDSNWSVLEGDEFYGVDLSKELHNGPKFLTYKPKYLVITNIGYEHQDVFPTQQDYTNAFKKAVEMLPKDGLVIARLGDTQVDIAVQNAQCDVYRYAYSESESTIVEKNNNIYYITQDTEADSAATAYKIINSFGKILLKGETTLIGKYNLENILAAYLITHVTKLRSSITDEQFIQVVKEFKGPNKRLEVLARTSECIVMDDFAVAPNRVKNTLDTVHESFDIDLKQIITVFEPNSASRPHDESIFKEMYKDAFLHAPRIILPHFSEFNEQLITSNQAALWLRELYPGKDILVLETDQIKDEVLQFIKQSPEKDVFKIVIFMSSYRLTEIAHNFAKSIQ